MAGTSSNEQRGGADADVIREQVRVARQRRAVREEAGGSVLGALVRMLDTPPVTDEPDPAR